ncbi:MAG: hypothetical protein ACYTGQ_12535 [Planctomycetota bacterium]|jgi:hypothetical protein
MKYHEFTFTINGKRCFTFNNEEITLQKKRTSETFPLVSLDPKYRVVYHRGPAFVVGMIGLCLGMPGVFYGLVYDKFIFSEAPGATAAFVSGMGLIMVLISIKKIKFAVFHDTSGAFALQIAQKGPDVLGFEPFIKTLSQRIEHARDEYGVEREKIPTIHFGTGVTGQARNVASQR